MGEIELIVIYEDGAIRYLIGNTHLMGDDEIFYADLKDNKIPPREQFRKITLINDENSNPLKLKFNNIKIGCQLLATESRPIRDVEGTVRQRETITRSRLHRISKIFQRTK